MSKEQKKNMMDKMMENFDADMTLEDKQNREELINCRQAICTMLVWFTGRKI
jgi:hypothetical protein